MKWSEKSIARSLANQFFNRKYLVVVPNCNWTGYEADILAITNGLRVIDVEIKISRADLKADARKDKWWSHPPFAWGQERPAPEAREHPPKVWKHYYAMPAEIWRADLEELLPSQTSGILLLHDDGDRIGISCRRQAKPARDAYRLTPEQAINVARLASLRMWEAYREIDSLRQREAA